MVAVGRTPAAAAGLDGDDSVVEALLAHPRLERVPDAEAGAAAVAGAAGHATGDVPLLVRRNGEQAVALVTGAFPDARTQPPRGNHDIDPARYARTSSVTVHAPVAEAEVWNPATGVRCPAHVTVRDNLKRFLIRACPDALSSRGHLDRAWSIAAEEAADAAAVAERPASAVELAEALIRVARLAAPRTPELASAFYLGGSIESRIRRLVGPPSALDAPTPLGCVILTTGTLCFAAIVFTTAPALHQVMEAIVSRLP